MGIRDLYEDPAEWFRRNVKPDWLKDKVQLEYEAAFHRGEIKNNIQWAQAKEELEALRKANYARSVAPVRWLKKAGGLLGLSAAVAAGAGALLYVANNSRNKQTLNPDDPNLGEDVPNVSNVTSPSPLQVLDFSAQAAPTMPDIARLTREKAVLGKQTRNESARRGWLPGMQNNIGAINPALNTDAEAIDLGTGQPAR